MASAKPRSSFSHNPLLRVSRPVSACSRCRSAKVKCDGKLPACTACEKAGREKECSAANDQFARGKERSYVAALELRIEKLEKRLQYAEKRKASIADRGTDVGSVDHAQRHDSMAKIRAAVYRKAERHQENTDVNRLVSDFGYLSVNATTRDFEPATSNMTFARLVLAAVTVSAIPDNDHPGLPARQVAQSIIQYYIQHIYSFYPCFPETVLWTAMDNIYQEHAATDSEYWMLYMVLATGSLAQSQKMNDEHYTNGTNFVLMALEFADGALTPGHISQIQSLILFTQYSMMDPNHFDSWHLIGFTARAVVDLGLHQDPPVSSQTDKNALEMRRRIFYTTYSLDRAISMVHARAFSFIDDTVNVAFPKPASSEQHTKPVSGTILGPQSVDSALLLFQLRRAQSFWYQELWQSGTNPLPDPESYVWRMCLEMREWGDNLPKSLEPSLRRMFEQELRYSYVYCMSPSAKIPQITNYHRILIFEYAVAYLDEMHDISHSQADVAIYTYHDTLKVYFVANQLLTVLRDAEDVLLSGALVPMPMQRHPGAPPAPPLPRSPRGPPPHNIIRSLRTLETVPQTLAKYSERWEGSDMLKLAVEGMSQEMLQSLQARAQMLDANTAQQPTRYPLMHPPGNPALGGMTIQAPPPAVEVRWVGVDPSSMREAR